MRADWVEKNPNAAKAMLMAVMEAQQWCDGHGQQGRDGRRSSAAGSGSTCRPPTSSAASRATSTTATAASPHGTDLYMKFWARATRPIRSRATTPGSSPRTSAGASSSPTTDIKALVDKVNREDLWREAAKALGVAAADIPAIASRGKETFFDGKVFDPDNPSAYLASLGIKRVA